jgi:hypothetical protein
MLAHKYPHSLSYLDSLNAFNSLSPSPSMGFPPMPDTSRIQKYLDSRGLVSSDLHQTALEQALTEFKQESLQNICFDLFLIPKQIPNYDDDISPIYRVWYGWA